MWVRGFWVESFYFERDTKTFFYFYQNPQLVEEFFSLRNPTPTSFSGPKTPTPKSKATTDQRSPPRVGLYELDGFQLRDSL